MQRPTGTPVYLFVSGEPDSGPDPLQNVETSVFRRASGVMLGGLLVGSPSHPPTPKATPGEAVTDQTPWHLPPPEAQCVAVVVAIAAEVRRSVVIVDVNRTEGHADLVERWVRPYDLFPFLVRSDGQRLEGQGEFTPRKVRRFLRGA
jgi:hypothetical protein